MSEIGRMVAGGVTGRFGAKADAALEAGELIISLADLVGPEGGAIMQITKLYEQAQREAKRLEAENTRLREIGEAWKGENDLIARQRDAARADLRSERSLAHRLAAQLDLTLASKRTQKTNAKRARGELREARIEAERLRTGINSFIGMLKDWPLETSYNQPTIDYLTELVDRPNRTAGGPTNG